MAYHKWGDEDFDWKSLYTAERWIARYVKRWSGCTLISKEKYGTIRYEHIVPPGGHAYRLVGNIVLPFIRVTCDLKEVDGEPKVVKKYGLKEKTPIYLWSWNESRLYFLWRALGYKVLWRAIRKACKKWPHITDELQEDFALNKRIVGKEVYNRYWTGVADE